MEYLGACRSFIANVESRRGRAVSRGRREPEHSMNQGFFGPDARRGCGHRL
jgi:hypothetical protein